MIDLLVSSIVAVFTGLLSAPGATATPFGLWRQADAAIEAQLYACGDKLCGRVITSANRNSAVRPGAALIKGATKTGLSAWEGPMLDTASGRAVAGTIMMQGPDVFYLKGCAALSLCRDEVWNRVK